MTAIRHTDLVSEEFLQGLIDRLSRIDLQLEEVKAEEGTPPGRDPGYELQRRYDALADEVLRQLINWHRDSFNVRFAPNGEDSEFLQSISTPKPSPLEEAQTLKLRAEADLITAQAIELRGEVT